MNTLTPEQVRLYEWVMMINRGNKIKYKAQLRKIKVPVDLRATLDPPRSLSPNYSYECPETPE